MLENAICTPTCNTAVLWDTEVLAVAHWGIARLSKASTACLSVLREQRSDCGGSGCAVTEGYIAGAWRSQVV